MAGEDLTRALELLRGQRHSFMNHLQVIQGWLQLDKSERAVQHITRVAERMDAEGQVLRRVEDPAVGIFLLAVALEAEPYGVTLQWRVTGPVAPAQLDEARGRILAALEQAARLPEGERRLVVTLGTPITVHTPSAMGEG